MVTPDPEEWKKALSHDFMTEIIFLNEIMKKVNDIYQHLPSNPNFPVGKPIDMKFQVVKKNETDYPELVLSPDAVFFVAGLGKAISDVILTELIPKMMPETKICNSCQCRINKAMKFCFNCGGSEFDVS